MTVYFSCTLNMPLLSLFGRPSSRGVGTDIPVVQLPAADFSLSWNHIVTQKRGLSANLERGTLKQVYH